MKPTLFASVSAAAAAAAALPPLNLVWFAGGGGSSEGLAQAGFAPDYALNHNATALLMHEANHPGCVHLQADAYAASPLMLEPGRPIDTFWASPDCKHFSKARGKAPVSPRIRGLCWSSIPWLKIRRPRVWFMENVEEFLDYGPLYPQGHHRAGYPIPERKGETFARFIRRIRQCGYEVEWKLLRANRYGAGTTRRRLYIVARCDGLPITWPAATHGPGLAPVKPFADCAEWHVPTQSLFLTPDEAKAAGCRRPLVAKSLARIFKGIERFVIRSGDPFIMHITHTGGHRVHDIRGFLPTVTSANRGEMALVAPTLAPSYGEREGQEPRAISVEDSYPTVVPGGNGGRLVTAHLGRQFGSTVSGRDVRDSAPTVMSEGAGGKMQLVAASLTTYYATGIGSAAGDPLRVATGEDRHAITAAWLEQANTGMVGHDARSSLSTIVSRGTTQRLVDVRLEAIGAPAGTRRRQVLEFLWAHAGEPTEAEWADPTGTVEARLKFGLVVVQGLVFEIADIGMRMLTVRELFNAQGFPPTYIIDRGPRGERITTTAATLMAGNSVCPDVARELAAANCNWPPAERERVAA